MDKVKFYKSKIEHNNIRIEKVFRAKSQVEKLGSDICSSELQRAINALGLVVAELLAENKHIEGLLQSEPSNNA